MAAAAVLVPAAAVAHDVISTRLTWSQEISRIVFHRCAACHREGGAAPMALLTYEQIRPWAKAIKEEILERRMPPWGAAKGFGEFVEDPSLSAEELHVIADWVEGGAPEGDPQYLPVLPAAPPPPPRRNPPVNLTLGDGHRFAAPVSLLAIAPPASLPEGASFQAIAELPGGGREPLIWMINYQPKHRRAFTYRAPVALPAGTRLRFSLPGSQIRVRLARTS